VAEKQHYLRSFGYGRRPFNPVGGARGIVTHRADLGTNQFHRFARLVAAGTLLPIDEADAAAAFGLLALDLFTTTGMRMNEFLQIRIYTRDGKPGGHHAVPAATCVGNPRRADREGAA